MAARASSSAGRGCAFLRSPQLLRQRLTARLARVQTAHEAAQHVRWLLQDGAYGPLDSRTARRRLIADVARLAQGEPLAYVIGTQPFAGLLLKCRAPTLIPRPETEEWGLRVAMLARRWAATLPAAERGIRVLDLCTGSGCLAMLLAHKLSTPPGAAEARVVAADVSPSALQLAEENAHSLPSRARPSVVRSDIFNDEDTAELARAGPYDLLVCNPPYIPAREHAALDDSVRLFEDRLALIGELPASASADSDTSDGLVFYRRIAALVSQDSLLRRPRAPRECPSIVLEVGIGQAPAVQRLMQPFSERVEIWRDGFGVDRVVAAWLHCTHDEADGAMPG